MPIQHQFQELSEKKRPVIGLVMSLLALAVLVSGLFATWEIWTSYRERSDSAAAETANMARVLGLHAETTFKIADLALDDIVERTEHDGLAALRDERLHAHLEHLSGKFRELHGLFIYDADGEWRATSLRRTVKANNADREYFQYHRNHPDRSTRIGSPVRSRSSGIWIIPVSRRLNHPDGSFAGVALATLRLDFFESVYSKLDVGDRGTVLLTLNNGTLYYRRPFVESIIGRDISSGPLMQLYRERGKSGTAMLLPKIDNVERLYSYRELDGFPLLVAAALSSDEIYAQWKTRSIQLVLGLVSLHLLLFWIGKKLLHQLRIREHLEEQLETMSSGLAQANRELSSLAMKDSLTQIANRRAFDAALAGELARANREGRVVSLLMLDVDYFKKFNDEYGHPAGDACLQRIALALAAAVTRPADLAARYGGEEFVVLLPGTQLTGAIAVAERIRDAIDSAGIVHAHSPTGQVTVSIGVAMLDPVSAIVESPETLLEVADAALYRAKRKGRNQIAFKVLAQEEAEAVRLAMPA